MSKTKQKGNRLENMVATKLRENGIPAERVPLSGSYGQVDEKYLGDVVIGSIDHPKARMECKFQQAINGRFWDWLEGNDFLVIKRNHKDPLVIMDMDKFIEMWKKINEV